MNRGVLALEGKDSIFNETNVKKLEDFYKKLFNMWINSVKRIFGMIKNFAVMLIQYAFMSYIYLSIYDSWGFEKTIIILLIGVVVFAVRIFARSVKTFDS